jgi:hypothetical protein
MTDAVKGLDRARTEWCMDMRENLQTYFHSKASV